jgi:NAD-reducing hydrogenase large subunit
MINNVNLIVATGHNNLAMNRAVTLVAKAHIRNAEVNEGILNRVEGAIRCYDPCLSCATHAIGQMQLTIEVRDMTGLCIARLERTS